jgi:phosphoglycolate phosphatase
MQGRQGLGSASAILWDIDGTLMTSGGVAARAFLDAVEHVTSARPSIAGIDFGGRIDPEIATLLLATIERDVTHIPAILARLGELMHERVDDLNQQTRPLAGTAALLQRFADAGIRQTVVTGNIESVAKLKLAAASMIPPVDPELGGYGDSGPDRVEVARFALRRLFGHAWPDAVRNCWIIGDTPRDLACARALGLRCLLVGTGRNPASAMTGLGADAVLTSLDEVAQLADLWLGAPGP